jgi:DNA-binding MarR family transcriptional regulator
LDAVEKADFVSPLQGTGMTRGNLSTHLTRLSDSGYIQIEKTFRGKIPQTLLCLTDSGRKAFEDYRGWLKKLLERTP